MGRIVHNSSPSDFRGSRLTPENQGDVLREIANAFGAKNPEVTLEDRVQGLAVCGGSPAQRIDKVGSIAFNLEVGGGNSIPIALRGVSRNAATEEVTCSGKFHIGHTTLHRVDSVEDAKTVINAVCLGAQSLSALPGKLIPESGKAVKHDRWPFLSDELVDQVKIAHRAIVDAGSSITTICGQDVKYIFGNPDLQSFAILIPFSQVAPSTVPLLGKLLSRRRQYEAQIVLSCHDAGDPKVVLEATLAAVNDDFDRKNMLRLALPAREAGIAFFGVALGMAEVLRTRSVATEK